MPHMHDRDARCAADARKLPSARGYAGNRDAPSCPSGLDTGADRRGGATVYVPEPGVRLYGVLWQRGVELNLTEVERFAQAEMQCFRSDGLPR